MIFSNDMQAHPIVVELYNKMWLQRCNHERNSECLFGQVRQHERLAHSSSTQISHTTIHSLQPKTKANNLKKINMKPAFNETSPIELEVLDSRYLTTVNSIRWRWSFLVLWQLVSFALRNSGKSDRFRNELQLFPIAGVSCLLKYIYSSTNRSPSTAFTCKI